MTTDIEITLSLGKKAWATPHSGTFVVHEESRVHLGEPVKDEYSALWRVKIRLGREKGKEALVKELWCGSSHWIHEAEGERWLIHSFLKQPTSPSRAAAGLKNPHVLVSSSQISNDKFFMPKCLFRFYPCSNLYQGLHKTWEASTGCWGPNICRISGNQTTS